MYISITPAITDSDTNVNLQEVLLSGKSNKTQDLSISVITGKEFGCYNTVFNTMVACLN
jgi:hypothetical protein